MSEQKPPTPAELLAPGLPESGSPPAEWFAAIGRSPASAPAPNENSPQIRTRAIELARSRPSDSGHAFLPGAAIFSDSGGLDFGSLVHDALAAIEWLPAVDAPKSVESFLAHDDVLPLFTKPPGFVELWRERAVTAKVDGRIVSAQMDRVIVTEREIVLIDFKTDQGEPSEIAGRYHGQMHAYLAILEAWSRGRHSIRAVIATVRTPAVVPIPPP